MGDLVLIEAARNERDQALSNEREDLAVSLELLAARVRAGKIIAACVATVPTDRASIGINALKTSQCGWHELVGASTILATYVANTVAR